MKCDSDVAGSLNSPCLETDNVFPEPDYPGPWQMPLQAKRRNHLSAIFSVEEKTRLRVLKYM